MSETRERQAMHFSAEDIARAVEVMIERGILVRTGPDTFALGPIQHVLNDAGSGNAAPLCVCGDRPADVGGLCPECRADRD